MATVVDKKRKVIDLSADTFKALSVAAASSGTNLKHFIESYLNELAENINDAALYKYMTVTDKEGQEMLSETEQADFEKKYNL